MLKAFKRRLLLYFFKRYAHRIEALTGARVLSLDYPAGASPKYALKCSPASAIVALVRRPAICVPRDTEGYWRVSSDLEKIPVSTSDPLSPQWENIWFSTLDVMTSYAIIASRRPARIIEIGSGYSMKLCCARYS